LKAAPPDRIVLLARNEEEVGAHQFGDQVGHGQLILQFIEQNYNRIGTLGGAPLPYDPSHPGAWVFALKPPGTPAAAAAPAATPPATNTAPANPPPTPPPAP
jgi:hypothetical protein